jgi:hypothetical protein
VGDLLKRFFLGVVTGVIITLSYSALVAENERQTLNEKQVGSTPMPTQNATVTIEQEVLSDDLVKLKSKLDDTLKNLGN